VVHNRSAQTSACGVLYDDPGTDTQQKLAHVKGIAIIGGKSLRFPRFLESPLRGNDAGGARIRGGSPSNA
jgi:hypothetical protein